MKQEHIMSRGKNRFTQIYISPVIIDDNIPLNVSPEAEIKWAGRKMPGFWEENLYWQGVGQTMG